MNQRKLSTAVASVLLASASVLGHGVAMASQVDVAPLPSGVIDFVVNQPVGPKAVMAEQFIQAVNQMHDVLSRHVGPAPRLSPAQTATYLAAARSDIAAQNGSLSSIRSEVNRAFKSTAGAQAALRELALLESALSRVARADSVDELRTSAKAAMALLTRYQQANERDQAAASPAHPTLSLPTPYQMAPLPVAKTLPSYAIGDANGVPGVLTASLGNAVLLPTPTEAASCGYTSADLDKTREEVNSIKYPEIAALAKSLGYSPTKIFNYVYENIDYQYDYFGSLKGAYGAYLTKRGNAFDQASLLIALLRASNIPARYVFGNAQVTDAAPAGADGRVNRWLGTNSYTVSRIVHQRASGNAPILLYNASLQPIGLRTFHVWVQACVPYANYRGAALSSRGYRWIPLDASFKDKTYQPGIANTVGFDLEAFLARRTNGADSLPHEKFLKDVEVSVRSTHPGKGLKDVPYKGKINPVPFDVLPATLPYQVHSFIDVGGGISDPPVMPDIFRQTLKIVVSNPSNELLVERSIPLVEGLFKRMTLSYRGINAAHQARIDAWRNSSNMDSPEPSCSSSDPTLVLPSIKLDGVEVAAGVAAKGLSFCVNNARLAMHVSVPHITCTKNGSVTSEGCVNSTHFTNIESSALYALLAYGDHASTEFLQKRISRLQASIKSSLISPNSNPDEIEGEFLNIVAQKYGRYVNDAAKRISDGSGRSISILGVHLGVTKAKSKISYVFDQPFAVNRKGFVIDVPGGQASFIGSSDGKSQLDLFFLGGRTASALESYVWQENARTDAVSTIRGLQFANETGNTVVKLTSANWATESSKLSYSVAHIQNLKAQVDAGATVYTPKSSITYDDWKGTVYISERTSSPATATYAISGGYSGGYTTSNPINHLYNPITNTGYGYIAPPKLPTFNSVVNSYAPPPVVNSYVNYGNTLGNTYSGDPVNMVTGNMYHNETDVDIPLRAGHRLVFQRAYNSRKPVDGPLGYGWTHSFNQHLIFKDDNANGSTDAGDTDGKFSSATWVDGTGGETHFTAWSQVASTSTCPPNWACNHAIKFQTVAYGNESGSTEYRSPPGSKYTMQKAAVDEFHIKHRDGSVYVFEGFGQRTGAQLIDLRLNLLRIQSRNGSTISLSYDASKRLSTVSDGTRTLTFTYDGASTRIRDVTDNLGRKHVYAYDGSGNLEKMWKPGVATTATPSMSYTYHNSSDGPNLDHAMKRFTPARGNYMEFTYYPNGRVQRHVNAQGEAMSFSYNDFRRETVQINERGHERRFFFDKNGMMIKSIEENMGSLSFTYGAEDSDQRFDVQESVDVRGAKTSYAYDSAGNLTKTTYPSGRTLERTQFNAYGQPGKIKDVRGLYTLFKYDTNGNVLEQILLKSGFGESATAATYAPSSADAKAQIKAWTINTYHANGNLLSSKQVRNMETKEGPSVEYAYEPTNTYRNKVTRKGDKDGDGTIATSEFDTVNLEPDAVGQTKTGIDGRWETVTYDYDTQGRLKSVTNAAGLTTRIEYDANGNVKLQKLESTVAGVVRQLQATSHEYDQADRKVRTSALGMTAAFEYDAAGNLIKQTDPDGRTLTYVYDEMNRLVEAADKEGNRVVKTLDIDGRPLSVTDANGLTTTYTYWDASRDFRLKRVTSPKSGSNANGRAVEYDYDAGGNVKSTKVLPADGSAARETLSTYDELSRPVRVVGPVVADPAHGSIRRVTKYTYDNLGRLTDVHAGRTDASGTNTGTDAVTLQARYTYDDFGRKLKDIDGAGRAWVYAYNTAGDVVSITDPRGKTTTQQWMAGGYLKQRQNEVGTVTYTRDALGLPTRVTNTNPAYTQDFTYNAQRRLASVRDSRGGKTLSYDYSKAGQLNAMRDSEGGETNYLYDGVGRLIGLWAANYDYLTFGYDKAGRLTERWSPNGVKAELVYNEDGTLASVRHVVAGAEKAKHSYQYDAWGNRKEHAENLAGTELKYGYEYDELDRLVKAQYTQGSSTTLIGQYRYDILNNRTRVTDASGNYLSYLYDTAGGVPANAGAQQLNQIDLYNAAGVKQSTQGTFSYDAAGNLTEKTVGGTRQTLNWDANNDLRQVQTTTLSGGTTVNYNEQYAYDHEARRTARQMVTGTTLYSSQYWYNGEDIHKEYGLQWVTPVAAYTHGPATDDALIHQSAAGNAYYHADGLGSATLLTDVSGNLKGYRRFDPWGRVIGAGGVMPTYGFTGREPDLSTGYIYYRARYYDPMLGRFISRDPIGLEGGLNVYAYVENNPTNFTDPSGLYAKSITNTVSNVGAAISSYYDTYNVGTRMQGAAQLGFGLLEVGLGAAGGIASGWTGVGAVAGAAVVGMGVDNAAAGYQTMMSGQATASLMDRGLAGAGVNPMAAAGIGIVLSGGTNANAWAKGGKYSVGAYNEIRGTVAGMDAHHVGQKALMQDLIPGYDPMTAPAILVPKVGHTIKGPNGILSRSVDGLSTPRDVLARDIRELRRVYPDVPNSSLRDLIQMNKHAYPGAFGR